VLLSASTHETIPSLERTVRLIKQHGGARTQRGESSGPVIGYGGGVFNRQPELRCRIDAKFLGCDGIQAIDACNRLLAERPVVAQG